MDTKNRILKEAIQLFNKKGYHAFNLSDIAQLCSMSRGNLAYHFKNKNDILTAIAQSMLNDIKYIQQTRKDYPAFSNLSLDVRTCGILQKKYPFVFRDMSVLEHQPIKKVLHDWSKKTIQHNVEAFAFAIEIGNMKKENYPGLYYQLAVNAWLVTYYWITQKAVRKVNKAEAAEKMIWNTIMPYFTDKGLQAFKAFYGNDYLKMPQQSVENYKNQKQLF